MDGRKHSAQAAGTLTTRRRDHRTTDYGPRSADFEVCRIAGFKTRVPAANPTRSILQRTADLEIGEPKLVLPAGLETCATSALSAPQRGSLVRPFQGFGFWWRRYPGRWPGLVW